MLPPVVGPPGTPHQDTGHSAAVGSPVAVRPSRKRRQLYVPEGPEQAAAESQWMDMPQRRRRRRAQYQLVEDVPVVAVDQALPSPAQFVAEGSLSFDSRVDQQYILRVLLEAAQVNAEMITAAATRELLSRIGTEALDVECVKILCEQAQIHSVSYGVIVAVVDKLLDPVSTTASSDGAISIDQADTLDSKQGLGPLRVAAHCLLIKVFGDLDVIWEEPSGERRELIRSMSMPTLRLLLSSSALRVSSEDTVVTTIAENKRVKAALLAGGTQLSQLRDLAQTVRLEQLSVEGFSYSMQSPFMLAGHLASELARVQYSLLAATHGMRVEGPSGAAAEAAQPRPMSFASRTLLFTAPVASLGAALGALERDSGLDRAHGIAAAHTGRYPYQAGRKWQAEFVVVQSPVDGSVELCLDLDFTFPGPVSVAWSSCGITVDFLCVRSSPAAQAPHVGPARFTLHSACNCHDLLELLSHPSVGQHVTVRVIIPVDFGLGLLASRRLQQSAEQMAKVIDEY